MIETEQRQFERWVLTDEGEEVVERGSHEARMFQAVDADNGSLQTELMVRVLYSISTWLLVGICSRASIILRSV